MAEIHRLAARVVTSNLDCRTVVLGKAIDFICWPFMAWKQMAKIDAELLTAAAGHTGRSPRAQKWRSWWFCARLGVPPEDYFNYALYRPDAAAAVGDYLLQRQSLHIYHTLYLTADPAEGRLLVDKAAICDALESRGIATVVSLAVAQNGRIDFRHPLDSPAWHGDIVMKPMRGSNGSGFYRWLRDKDGGYTGALGESQTLEDILTQIRALSQRRPILIQQRLLNDDDTARLTGGGLATVRVVTARHASGRITVMAAALKMPVGDALVDNFMRGNVISQIDVSSGGMRAGQSYRQRHATIDCHPDTQALFAGRQVPQWEEIRHLAISTHRHFQSYVLLAFDIAPAPGRPVIVEINVRGDLSMVQYQGGTPMGRTSYPDVVLSHMREREERGFLEMQCFG